MPFAVQSCIPVFSCASRKLTPFAILLWLLFALVLHTNAHAGAKEKKIDSLKLALPGQNDTTRINTLIKIAQGYHTVNKDSAMKYALLLCREAEAVDSLDRLCDAYVILGTCFRHLNNVDSAMFYKRKGYEVGRQGNYAKGEANAANDIGLYLKEFGDYDSAIYYVLQSIEIREQNEIEKPLGVSYTNLGLIYEVNGDTTNAMLCYRKAAAVATKFQDFRVITACLNNIASVHDVMGKTDSAMFYYTRVLNLCDSLEDEDGTSRAMINIGVVYRNKGEFVTAEKYFLDAVAIKIAIEDSDGEAIASLDIAENYRLMKRYALSEKYLVRADTLAQSLNQKELQRDIYQVYADLYSETGRPALALEYFRKYDALNKLLLDDEKIRAMEEMRTRFGSVKKERENAQLREEQLVSAAAAAEDQRQKKIMFGGLCALVIVLGLSFYAYRTKIKSNKLLESKNEQISRQNSTLKELNKKLIDSEEELTALNATKDQLFSIISHDLGNPVNAIVNYNTVVQSRKDSMTKEDMAQSLEKVNLTLRPLQEFLENLLQWSVQQKNGVRINKEKFSITEVVDEIATLYMGSMGAKQLQMHTTAVGDVIVDTDKNIARLLLRNLIGNAIKFSPVGGRIDVGIDTVGGKLVVSVADNGAGISKEKLEKIRQGGIITSERGTAMETGTGLGLNLVREFLNALGGKLEIESENGKTVVTARFS